MAVNKSFLNKFQINHREPNSMHGLRICNYSVTAEGKELLVNR